MNIYQAFYHGIIEGLTEYIPVSSTAHLILLSELLGVKSDKSDLFDIFIQLGAILAVVLLYHKRFRALLDFSTTSGKASFKGWHGILRLGLACLPTFILGFLFHKKIKAALFAPTPIAVALIVGGVAMLLVERRRRQASVGTLEQLSLRDAALIGLFQCFSLWPGISRAGATIVGAILLGAERKVAAEFSFLVAVPVLFAAVAFDMLKNFSLLDSSDLMAFTVGFVVSFLTAVAAIKFFIGLLARYTLKPFAIYRIALGIIVLFAL